MPLSYKSCKTILKQSGTLMPKQTFAWMVHGLTASGALLAFLAFVAIERAEWQLALCWLAAAMIVDAIDGPLARLADTKRNTPRIDGATLDLVVDYLTFVFVRATPGSVPRGK